MELVLLETEDEGEECRAHQRWWTKARRENETGHLYECGLYISGEGKRNEKGQAAEEKKSEHDESREIYRGNQGVVARIQSVADGGGSSASILLTRGS